MKNMILVEVEFNNGNKFKIQIDIDESSFCQNDIIRTLNGKYLNNWKSYKILSEVE